MARNVEAVWRGDRRGMGHRARAHVAASFNWERTFSRLTGEVYAAALMRAAERDRQKRTWISFAAPRFLRKAG